tara:strand:- start:499 stop:681 length:183 start_codon:yes stop_codon:yes gene_type:complete
MKIKLKEGSLPNIWKQCGASLEEWDKLHSGETIEVKSVPETIENLVEVIASSKKSKKENK